MGTGAKDGIAACIAAALLCVATDAAAEVVEYDLVIDTREVDMTGEATWAITVNGSIPGPTIYFTEGDTARIHVRNDMDVWSSVHWHGLLVPEPMDGVPYITFPGIAPHTTFTYEFPIIQAGTYWYHSHSGFQEQRGLIGSIVIHPKGPLRVKTDRDYVAVLSDWTNEPPTRVMGLLKSENEWYSVVRNANQSVWGAIEHGRLGDFLAREWESMPDNEIADVAYPAFFVNGRKDTHFEAAPGETVRLRLIDGSSSTYFYVQYACGPMTVVAADGQDVEPLELDRLLISVAETYDVIVKAPASGSCDLRVTAQDGSRHVDATVGQRTGESVEAPEVPFPNYYINTMNAGYWRAMVRTAWDVGGSVELFGPGEAPDMQPDGGMKMTMEAQPGRPMNPYPQLRAAFDSTIPGPRDTRVVNLKLTGDMDRYVWSMDGEIIAPDNTIVIKRGERVRFVLDNRTMMNHPMHLHGHFFRVLNGQGDHSPLKHTVNVAPMTTTVIEFDANEEKDWFFHCHILYHMPAGMERIVHYEGTEVDAATMAVRPKAYHDAWYAFGGAQVLSQMSQGAAQVSNTYNIIGAEYEIGYDSGEYDVTGAYNYYVNRYLSPFAGVNAYKEDESDVRGVFGFSWLLPMNTATAVWGGTDGSFRWSASKDLFLTRWIVGGADVEYDTKTDWEWSVSGEFIVNRWLSIFGNYDSEYGAGGGILLRVYSSPF